MASSLMIETRELTKKYSDGILALDHLSVRADKRVTSIIGRNGAGKTTLLRILSTQLMPTSGEAFVNDVDIIRHPDQIRNKIVSIPQEASPIGVLTAFEQVKLYLVGRGYSFRESTESANRSLDEIGLREFKHTPTDTLSGGMKRKVFVAMALASNADIVFLDEPTTGLDPLSRMEVWSAIRQIDSEIILTTHYMEEAQELSDDVILVEEGKILEQGTVSSLLKRFNDMVRAETTRHCDNCIKIANTYIRYIPRTRIQEYAEMGFTIRSITLDDLFISKGVNLES